MTGHGRGQNNELDADVEVARLLGVAAGQELPPWRMCLDLARAYERAGDDQAALRWVFAAVDAGEDLAGWTAAAALARRLSSRLPPLARSARVAVLGSYTTSQLTALLPLAAARAGLAVEVYECGYGQYRQEILDPSSGLYAFQPDVVVLAVHAGEATLPELAAEPDQAVAAEVLRWTSLWDVIRARSGARVVQHLFAVPPEVALGHLAARVPGARSRTVAAVNAALGREARDGVAVVDCDRLAADVGKSTWFDPRYWHRAKQAVSLGCVPMLARHTAAVLAAQLGAGRKVCVLDLDNTVWGGVIGEDGLAGIALGDGPAGEAFVAFQRYVLELKRKGVVLAVCSKNDDALAREVFQRHPDMQLTLEDIAAFSASWDDKPTQLRRIAQRLGLGLDSFLFVDDNPAEREVVRQLVPEVDVLALPAQPHEYVRALAAYPYFETAALTAEDAARTAQYQARARTAELAESATSLVEFHRSLDMTATIAPVDEVSLPRVTQLVGKTNQFNLTGVRRGEAEIAAFAADGTARVLTVRLADRFADHGLVAVVMAKCLGDAFDVDTFLMSCRVIGRTLEDEVVGYLAGIARELGCLRLVGHYVPSPKNSLVAGLYERLGFTRVDGTQQVDGRSAGSPATWADGTTHWQLDLGVVVETPGLIRVLAPGESADGDPAAGNSDDDARAVPGQLAERVGV